MILILAGGITPVVPPFMPASGAARSRDCCRIRRAVPPSTVDLAADRGIAAHGGNDGAVPNANALPHAIYPARIKLGCGHLPRPSTIAPAPATRGSIELHLLAR